MSVHVHRRFWDCTGEVSWKFFTTCLRVCLKEARLEQGGVDTATISCLLDNLSEPVAAASIGQVYKSKLPGYGTVAIKVQRPGLRDLVRRDEAMLRRLGRMDRITTVVHDSRSAFGVDQTGGCG